MTPERYQLLISHFDQACDLEPSGQAALIADVSASDPELAGALQQMLRHDRLGPDRLEAVPADLVSAAMAQLIAPAAGGGTEDIEPVALLAEGGMGQVLLARQRCLQRDVVVKTLRPEAATADAVAALRQEALLAGALEHPHIVPVHLLGQDGQGRPLLVMKHIEGVSWAALIRAPEHPAWSRLAHGGGDRLAAHLSILAAVCNAIDFAHSRGVLHRDIKPDNVMVGAFGEVYLLDWGIAARLGGGDRSAPGAVVGTPGYMAPEMVDPALGPLGAGIDVYLLGATLHHVLCGAPRHRGQTLEEILRAARASLPYAYGAEVPAELASICNRATAADPAARFPSAAALRDAVAEHLSHRGAITLCESAYERLGRLRAQLRAQAARSPPSAEVLGDTRRLSDLMAEGLFGFRESLRAWPGNARALCGLRSCLAAMVAYEIGQENLLRARVLLAELLELGEQPGGQDGGPPVKELVEQMDALRARLREREEREARLREIDRRQDWRVAARQRALVLSTALLVAIVLWWFTIRDQHGYPYALPLRRMTVMMGGGVAGFAALVVIFRRALLETDVTRHLVLGSLCGAAGMFVHRCLLLMEAPQTARIVSIDMLLCGTCAALGGLMLSRWLWIVMALFVSGAVLVRRVALEPGAVFAAVAAVCLTLALYLSQKGARRGG